MQQFCDSQGHPWKIELTIGSVKRVKNLIGVDLLQPIEMGGSEPDENEIPLLTQLELDPMLMTDVIYALVEPQAEQVKLTDVDFGTCMTAEVFVKAAEGFWQEYQDFFLQLGRKPVAAMIRSQRELAVEAFQSEEVDDLMEAKIKEVKGEAQKKIQQGIQNLMAGN